MAAGLATLNLYDQAAVDRINGLGQKLREGIDGAFEKAAMTGQATGLGSVAQIHWKMGEVKNAMHTVEGFSLAGDLPQFLHLELMNRGFYSAARGMLVISTAMDEAIIDRFLEEFAGALEVIKPYVDDKATHLLIK